MKLLFSVLAIFSLVSCNTSIGLWRDTKATYHWSQKKIQESNGGGSSDQDYEYSAPVY